MTKISLPQNLVGFESTTWLVPFCVELACSIRACVGSLRVLGLPPTVQRHSVSRIRLIGDSKLPIGVKVSVNGCLFLCLSPVVDWLPFQGVAPPFVL